MSTPRKRRFVKRSVVALAGIVLMLLGYVAAFGATCWLFGRGIISEPQVVYINETLFSPLLEHDSFAAYGEYCWLKGMGIELDSLRVKERVE
jgi:hypothetical protein